MSTSTTSTISEAERARRRELVRDSKAALEQGELLEARTQKREDLAVEWSRWFRRKMDEAASSNPLEFLPDALAQLEQNAKDQAAAAVAELKKSLREVLR
jgi:hypothetical protein